MHEDSYLHRSASAIVAKESVDLWIRSNVYLVHEITVTNRIFEMVSQFSKLDRWPKKKRNNNFITKEHSFTCNLDELLDIYCHDGTQRHTLERQIFEQLNIDFKGLLPSKNPNKYILTLIDKFSRFPFAFPCKDISATSVIHHLRTLFGLFGMPLYIHSDRASAFMSFELKDYFHGKGFATSRTTSFNPTENGLVKRMNGTIWKAVTLA